MEKSDIKILEFDVLKNKDLVHGVFTRHGGNSLGTYDSLNVGMHTGDDPEAVAANRKLVIKKMGMNPLIFLHQVHDDKIQVLKKDNNDLHDVFEPAKEVYTADGIITDIPGVALVIQVADCQGVMLYDPVKKVIANIHSGWRGSIKNIVGKCVTKMQEIFSCDPVDIIAGVSPSLGPCCAEFINYKDEIPKELWGYKTDDKPYFDFWSITMDQLVDKGVPEDQIENMNICTRCNTDNFYSYRGEKNTGRFSCIIAMKAP